MFLPNNCCTPKKRRRKNFSSNCKKSNKNPCGEEGWVADNRRSHIRRCYRVMVQHWTALSPFSILCPWISQPRCNTHYWLQDSLAFSRLRLLYKIIQRGGLVHSKNAFRLNFQERNISSKWTWDGCSWNRKRALAANLWRTHLSIKS